MQHVNIVILHWNDSSALNICLSHLTRDPYDELRIIVVDNGSSDLHQRAASVLVNEYRSTLPNIHLVVSSRNRGYAGGNNLGIQFCQDMKMDGDICILNPDVRLARTTLEVMRGALTPDVGLVMCRAINDEQEILYDAVTLRGFRQRFIRASTPIVETDYAQGACFLMRREIADEIPFDEKFFLYWEEVDLSLHVKELGYKVISVTTASIVRKENANTRLPNALYYSARNAILMKYKHPAHFSWSGFAFYLGRLLFISTKLYAQPRLLLQGVTAIFAGARDGVAGRFGPRTIASISE